MNIYIDESGTFIPTGAGQQSLSLIGGLIIPDGLKGNTFKAYKSIKKKMGYSNKEMKGNNLTNEQLAFVISEISKFDIIYHFIPTDLSYASKDSINSHQNELRDNITSSIHPASTENTIAHIKSLAEKASSLSAQLYIQFQVMIKLLKDILQFGITYYVQRTPKELGSFKFFIDPKDIERTDYEKIWLELFLPLTQTDTFRKPIMFLEGFDYSYFEKVYMRTTEEFPSYLKDCYGIPPFQSINAILNDINNAA